MKLQKVIKLCLISVLKLFSNFKQVRLMLLRISKSRLKVNRLYPKEKKYYVYQKKIRGFAQYQKRRNFIISSCSLITTSTEKRNKIFFWFSEVDAGKASCVAQKAWANILRLVTVCPRLKWGIFSTWQHSIHSTIRRCANSRVASLENLQLVLKEAEKLAKGNEFAKAHLAPEAVDDLKGGGLGGGRRRRIYPAVANFAFL